MFSGEIYDKAFYQMILPHVKNFRMPKADFEALVAELRPYISPNPSSRIIHSSKYKYKFLCVLSRIL